MARTRIPVSLLRSERHDRRGNVPPFYPTTIQFNADNPTARTVAWKEI